jgi:hypothetical protein
LLVAVGGEAGAVIAHHCLDGDAAGGVPGDRPSEERGRSGGGEVVQELGIWESGVVVDDDVQVLEAGQVGLATGDGAGVVAAAHACHAVARAER